jgi:hypothetical protein
MRSKSPPHAEALAIAFGSCQPTRHKGFLITSGVQLTRRITTNAALPLAVVIGAFAGTSGRYPGRSG